MAVTATKFNGDILGVYADGTLVANARDSTLTVNQDLISITTKDSGGFEENLHGNRNWEVSGSALQVFAAGISAVEVIDYILNASTVSIQFKTTNADDSVWSGSVSCSSASFSAAQNSLSGYDFTFTGNGILSNTSSQIQAILSKFTALSALETTSLSTYFAAEIANGNHALKDYELIFSLGSSNGLIDAIGTKTAVNNGATFSLNGAVFAGAESIDSNYNPTSDATNYSLNDMYVNGFVKVNNEAAANANLYIGGTSELFQNPGSTRFRYATNSALTNTSAETVFAANSLYGASRDGAASQDVYKDGISIASSVASSTTIPNQNIIIGSGSAANYFNGTISTFMISASVGFNFTAHNTNIRSLLTNLGLTL